MRICSKKGCKKIGIIIYLPTAIYCFQCSRFKSMRHAAQTKNKYQPSWEELEKILPKNMICPTCSKQMIWHSSLGTKGDVVSLQHNYDGSIMLICHSCNAGHGQSHLKDKYFDIPVGYNYCSQCKYILKKAEFNKCMQNKNNLLGCCKKCANISLKNLHKKRLESNQCTKCGKNNLSKNKWCQSCLKKDRKRVRK